MSFVCPMYIRPVLAHVYGGGDKTVSQNGELS
jgi:hypothetical protein